MIWKKSPAKITEGGLDHFHRTVPNEQLSHCIRGWGFTRHMP